MTDDELDLVETKDLVAAIHRRCGEQGAVVVIMMGETNGGGKTQDLIYRGGYISTIGLLSWAHHYLLTDYQSLQDIGSFPGN